jgi:putative hemolysin
MNMRISLLAILMLSVIGLNQNGQAIPNHASVNCVELGGNLLSAKNPKGEYGICVFKNNHQCEEWALFRGECFVGGVDITPYTTQEAVYCAVGGGQVLADEDQCQLPSGHVCPLGDYYAGECPERAK